VKVLNGYVLNCESDFDDKPYIFKTNDELMEILEQTVLKHFQKKEAENGRKNKKARGRVAANESRPEPSNSGDGECGAGLEGDGRGVVEHTGIAVCDEERANWSKDIISN
jgi:hypothetical protein